MNRSIVRASVLVAVCLLTSMVHAQNTATVTGNYIDPTSTAVTSRTSIDVELKGANGNQCKVAGTGVIVPYKQTFTPQQIVAGVTLIKNSSITCGTTTGQSTWLFTVKRDGTPQPGCSLQITANTNLNSASCLNATQTPVTAVPTSSLFALIDASNAGFTGAVTAPSFTATGSVSASSVSVSGAMSVGLRMRDCRTDGTFDLTGGTDNSSLVNTCIANAVANGQGKVVLPCGIIKINSAINLTNLSGVDFSGCGGTFAVDTSVTNLPVVTANTTSLLCNTGAVCVDRTGSSRIILHDFNIASGTTTASPGVVGILDGRDNAGGGGSANRFCFDQGNMIIDVFIVLKHVPTANSSNGSIPIFNLNAEHYLLIGGREVGDAGMFFLTSNTVGVASPYQTLQTGCPSSMTDVTVINNSALSGDTFNGNGIIAVHGAEFHFINQHVQAGTSVTAACYELNGTNIFIDGRCEGFTPSHGTALLFDGNADDIHFNVGTSNLQAGSGEWVGFTTTSFTVTNSDIRIQVTDGGSTLPFVESIADTIQNSTLRLSNTTSPLSATSLVCKGCMIDAPNHTDANIAFSSSSFYRTTDSTGVLISHGENLTTASGNNSVTLLNAQGVTGAITGTGADATIYTYTLPASTLAAGKGIRVTASFAHGTGTASVTYKLQFGATSCANPNVATTGSFYMEGIIVNNPASTSAQRCSFLTTSAAAVAQSTAGVAPAEATSGAIVIKLTFNVANTDAVTGGQFLVELIQ